MAKYNQQLKEQYANIGYTQCTEYSFPRQLLFRCSTHGRCVRMCVHVCAHACMYVCACE